MSRAHVFTAACILVCSAIAAPQGEITGIVIDADTGKPVVHARVTVEIRTVKYEQYGDVLVALTGEDGRFRFSGLPKSECDVNARKAGYGEPVGGHHVHVQPENPSVPITFTLTPKGGLTVRVVDDTGSPVDGAQVAVVRRGEENQDYAVNLSVASAARDGIRRVALVRGSYRIVAVSPGSGNLLRARGLTFLPTYYPGTTNVSHADWIDVVPGKEAQVVVPVSPIPARQIRGRLGFAGTLTGVSILPAGNSDYRVAWGLPQVSKDSGEFRVSGLTPGLYVLEFIACPAISCMGGSAFRKTIQVSDADIENLVIFEADRLVAK
jgi:5-hydroxyisourate hydrolase-like protein (transthyretin family)